MSSRIDRVLFRSALLFTLGLCYASGTLAYNCYEEQYQRTLTRCKAECEYTMDKKRDEFANSSWANFNRHLNEQTRDLAKESGAQDWKLRQYERTMRTVDEISRSTMINRCQEGCYDEAASAADNCY